MTSFLGVCVETCSFSGETFILYLVPGTVFFSSFELFEVTFYTSIHVLSHQNKVSYNSSIADSTKVKVEQSKRSRTDVVS